MMTNVVERGRKGAEADYEELLSLLLAQNVAGLENFLSAHESMDMNRFVFPFMISCSLFFFFFLFFIKKNTFFFSRFRRYFLPHLVFHFRHRDVDRIDD